MVSKTQARWDAARAALTEGLALCDEHHFAMPRVALLINLGEVLTRTGAYDDAERSCERAVVLARE